MSAKVEYRGGIPEIKKTGDTVAEAFPDFGRDCAVSTFDGSFAKNCKVSVSPCLQEQQRS